MTEAQLKALILSNLTLQVTQLTAIYTAVNATPQIPATIAAARAALAVTRDLEVILQDGLQTIRRQAQLATELGS